MAIIIREDVMIRGKLFKSQKIFYPYGIHPKNVRQRAEEIDHILYEEFKKIISDFRKEGLLKLLGKKRGVVMLWWRLGKRLSFVDNLKLDEIDKKLIWRAMYDHADDLIPGDGIPERAKRSPETSLFSYCYRLGKFPKNVALSQDWTAWVEFFDSPVIRNDERIIEWFEKKVKKNFKEGSKQDWIRNLTRSVRNELKNFDTAEHWSDEKLIKKLDHIFSSVYQ